MNMNVIYDIVIMLIDWAIVTGAIVVALFVRWTWRYEHGKVSLLDRVFSEFVD